MTTATINETTKGKKPSHVRLHVRDVKGKKYYTTIGVLWLHNDGKGFNEESYLTPTDGGKVIIREYSEAE
jgi:hypothetical protein